MIPTPIEAAYCAGVMDSDGCISIKRSTYAMRVVGDSKQATYSERVCVKQVERQAVDLLRFLFGGSFRRDRPSTPRGKPIFAWQVTDKKAVTCLEAIIPYLRIKTRQASNCLELRRIKELSKKQRVAVGRGHAGSAPRSEANSDAMEALFQRAKELNHVGI